MTLTLRYAESDADVVAIHGFLCIVAGPYLPGPINPGKSATEVWRVVNSEEYDFALMAMHGDTLVGTLGIVRPAFWWGDAHFLVNRWFFTLPGLGAGRLLIREAVSVAKDGTLELHIIDENKQRYRIFNRHPRRDNPQPIVQAADFAPRPVLH